MAKTVKQCTHAVCFHVKLHQFGVILHVKNVFFALFGTGKTVHSTTSTTETSTTDSTRITNAMATSSDYLMKYFNGFLAVLLE